MDETWIPIIGMICVFGLPIGGWITVRVLQHRERMAMLQRGMMPPPNDRLFRDRAFRGGRGWTMPPPQVAEWTVSSAPPAYGYGDPCSPQERLRKGIVTSAVGFALLIGLSFIGYHAGDGMLRPPSFHPGPWLLGGLIPLFVGVAQIAIAVMSGAQFGTFGSAPTAGPPPPGASPFGYDAPQPGSAGSRYEELARPTPPPERRSP